MTRRLSAFAARVSSAAPAKKMNEHEDERARLSQQVLFFQDSGIKENAQLPIAKPDIWVEST